MTPSSRDNLLPSEFAALLGVLLGWDAEPAQPAPFVDRNAEILRRPIIRLSPAEPAGPGLRPGWRVIQPGVVWNPFGKPLELYQVNARGEVVRPQPSPNKLLRSYAPPSAKRERWGR
jgi:hypothetical protein